MENVTSPIDRCPHGVYKAGEEVARYCSVCNPGPVDMPGSKQADQFRSRRKYASRHDAAHGPRKATVLDCVEFVQQPAGYRLASSPQETVDA